MDEDEDGDVVDVVTAAVYHAFLGGDIAKHSRGGDSRDGCGRAKDFLEDPITVVNERDHAIEILEVISLDGAVTRVRIVLLAAPTRHVVPVAFMVDDLVLKSMSGSCCKGW